MVDVSWSPELATMLGARDAGLLDAEGVPSLGDHLPIVDGARLAADPAGETSAACSYLTDPWWFHLDLDVLSTEALPAVDYPQDGGLGWEELGVVAATALDAGPVGWDVTIYNPDLDPQRTHARRIVRFISSAVRSRW